MSQPHQTFVLLTEVSDPNTAQLLAAKLRAEGIESRVVGEAEGPYRLTVGSMAVTQLWVPEPDLPGAQLVMLAAEADAAVSESTREGLGPSADPGRSWLWWSVAALLLAVTVWLYLARFL
jgi:hypothetical protein